MTHRRLLGLTLAAGALGALAVFGLASSGSSTAGRRAPALPREALSPAPPTLSKLLAGARDRPVLVVFWASWCGPCAREAPALERFSQSPFGRGRMVGVDWSDAAAPARAFIRHYTWTFPNVRDAEGTVGNAYRMTVLPTTFVIDGHGHIRAALRGPQTEASLTRALGAVERV
jgi:cytochrome c biogenesis protein CcmG, thiol:disulfide interchange protein DsbE